MNTNGVSTISAEFPNMDFVFQQNIFVGWFHFTFSLPGLLNSLITYTFMRIQVFWGVLL
jgi:hypothetical protein